MPTSEYTEDEWSDLITNVSFKCAECGGTLNLSYEDRDSMEFQLDMCEGCHEVARDQAHDEGFDYGFSDGHQEGYGDGLFEARGVEKIIRFQGGE